MQKREMSTKESIREAVISKLVNGEVDATEASKMVGLSVRQVKRLKATYLKNGKNGLIHQARGKPGTRRTDKAIEDKIIATIKRDYHDFGPLLANEKLQQNHGIHLDTETIRQMMIRAKIWTPKKRKRPEYHCWRERRAGYGQMQQFDGSYHDWFESRNSEIPEACLLLSMDDATGKITQAVFEDNEGVEAVFRFWKQYIEEHGIPCEIYMDKFSTYKINHVQAVDNFELMTQFQRATKELDIRLIHANSPQAKGRVERSFQTLQDRLVKELRLQNISTKEEANVFLKEVFIPYFNSTFSIRPRTQTDMHRPVEVIKPKLEEIFSRQSGRSINTDFTIRFKNNWYQLKEIQPTTVFKADKVIMEERLDGTIHIKCNGHYLNAFVLPERPKKMKTNPLILTPHKSNWKPAPDHPWRTNIL